MGSWLDKLSKSQKLDLAKIVLSALLLLSLKFFNFNSYVQIFMFFVAYLLVAYDVIIEAFHGITSGQLMDENFLMTIATFGALYLGDYNEAVFVMLLFAIGELFESIAVGSSRRSIQSLIEYSPEEARVLVDGAEEIVWPEDVNIGDTIVVYPGEKVPIDGIVIEGNSTLDQAFLTGESIPVDIDTGDPIQSGSINLTGVLKIEATKIYEDSTVSKIMELIELSADQKSQTEAFITRFARWYTPAVVIGAILLAVLPNFIFDAHWSLWVRRALVFLVVSCPCALVISVPLSFFGGIGRASREGILIKGSNYLEVLADLDTVAFDKTGTLTRGVFDVREIVTEETDDEWLKVASAVESYSNHPIAQSIVKNYGEELTEQITDVQEVHGKGLVADYNGSKILVGNDKLLIDYNVDYTKVDSVYTQVHVVIDSEYKGTILVGDSLKSDTKDGIDRLKADGIKSLALVTGDKKEVAESIANEIGLNRVYAELLPEDKVNVLRELIDSSEKKVAYVGDGINDGPVLRMADVGIAMGAMGSDVAIESADVVLMDDQISKIPTAVEISQKTIKIANQNIWLSLIIKFGALALAVAGITTMGMAIFADTGVMMLAVLNSMRTMKK